MFVVLALLRIVMMMMCTLCRILKHFSHFLISSVHGETDRREQMEQGIKLMMMMR